MVRLQANLLTPKEVSNPCFNSKMVRLQGVVHWIMGHDVPVFQFQNGAIARSNRLLNSTNQHSFNSKMVRLQVSLTVWKNVHFWSFNSKMVRLQDKDLDGSGHIDQVSIPKWCDCKRLSLSTKILSFMTFQFQNGAIASRKILLYPCRVIKVSIPKWCDCKDWEMMPHLLNSNVSIPKWCDCKFEAFQCGTWFLPSFNSKMVRLQGACKVDGKSYDNSFNSKMVRLQAM